MYKKNFVSISFFDREAQVVLLDSNKKKVLKLGTIPLPNGIIQNSKVLNSDIFGKTIATGLKKLNIVEKSVGIVVQEFSTFNRLLTIPKLEDRELDEAVRFRFQDFYEAGDEMVLDWKIVGENNSQYEVLAVAIPLAILSSFIDPLDKIGLLPLVVETPSISLVRLCSTDASTKLIIYKGEESTLLTLSDGKKIIGTSVLDSNSSDVLIINTCDQIIKHYSNIEMNKIFIGGINLSENLLSLLKETFKKPISSIQINDIKGTPNEDLQKYMIPLSLALHDPKEPKDELSINLLPPIWIKKYEDKRASDEMWTLTLIFSVIVWACFFTSAIVFAILISEQTNVNAQKQKTVSNLLPSDVANEIQNINKLSSKVISISQSSDDPNAVVNKINKTEPEDLKITSYHIDFDSKKIILSGKSNTLASLIKFKHDLELDEDFSNVEVPLSNLGSQTNLDFNMTLDYKLEAKAESQGKINIQ